MVQADNTATFSPLARAVMDSFDEGVVVFDSDGRLIYANEQARSAADEALSSLPPKANDLLPELAKMGGRLRRLRSGKLMIGEAVFIPIEDPTGTLAEREKQAIIQVLEANGWRLADSARQLGISRTTLWRRLRAYGLRNGRN